MTWQTESEVAKRNDPSMLVNLIRRVVDAGFSVAFGKDILACLDGRVGGDHPLAKRLQEVKQMADYDARRHNELSNTTIYIARIGSEELGFFYGSGIGFGDTEIDALRDAIDNEKKMTRRSRDDADKRLVRLEKIKTEG